MFCMGCGAETPPYADRCPVCGRAIERAVGDNFYSRYNVAQATPVDATLVTRSEAARTQPAMEGPSITNGDLDSPGLPRDATGRALLIAVVAMAADLLAPWINFYGQHLSPAMVGAPALLIVALLALAALPLMRPSWRKRTEYAAVPIVIGGICFGAALVVWIVVTIAGSQRQSPTESQLLLPSNLLVAADVGLYLFAFGAGVLVFAGYQLFLAAASARAATRTPLVSALLLAAGTAEATDEASTSSAVPTPLALPTPAAGDVALASNGDAQPASSNGHVPLPGTAAWDAAPAPQTYTRPISLNGWRRQSPRR